MTSNALNAPVLSAERRALVFASAALREIAWSNRDDVLRAIAWKALHKISTLVPNAGETP